MTTLTVNQLFRVADNESIERVLWIDSHDGGVFSIDIGEPSALPVYRSGSYLNAQTMLDNLILIRQDPWSKILVAESSIKPKHKAIRDKNWQHLFLLIQQQPAIFDGTRRGKIIAEIERETGVHRRISYALLRRYWQRGLSPNALLPDYANCGAPNKEKPVGTRKRGRPALVTPGMNVTPGIRKIFRQAVMGSYAKTKVMTFSEAYKAMITKWFCSPVVNEMTGQQEWQKAKVVPSKGQFRYWYEKETDIYVIKRQRRTARVYDKDMRAILGSSTAEVDGPGSRYQIDATIADIYLVSRYDRTKIIGRPVVYLVIDVFSRMIVGLHVGLEGPSWVGAMQALGNAICSKADYCKRFGIDIDETQWPCSGIPQAILADRGEVMSAHADTLINNFGVNFEHTPPFRADLKGIVEQRFRMLPAAYMAYAPGYIQTDYKERGGSDYRLDATLDIDEFTRIMIKLVMHFNQFGRIDHYVKPKDMIADRVDAIPIQLWDWGIARRSGKMRAAPEEFVLRSLLPSDDAIVTESGIRFQGLFYTCPYAMERHWFERARQKHTFRVRVSYDPRNMDNIYLHGQPGDKEKFITCDLTVPCREHRGRTLWEIDQIRQEERLMKLAHQDVRLGAEVSLRRELGEMIDDAAARKPDVRGQSKRERTANIRANRSEEQADLRHRDALRPEKQAIEAAQVVEFPAASPTKRRTGPLTMSDYLRAAQRDGHDKT